MKYGTQTRTKYTVPYLRYSIDQNIKDPLVRMRLQWMLYIDSGHSVSKCSRHFDIPLRTVWYWKSRYDSKHISRSLSNKPRKPIHCRISNVSELVVKYIKDIRRKNISFGRNKIQSILKKKYKILIGRSRIQTIVNSDYTLKYFGRFKQTNRRHSTRKKHMYDVPKEILNIPGGLIYLDVKHLSLQGGLRVYQFVGIDHATRMTFSKVYTRITSKSGAYFIKHIQKMLEDTPIQYIGSDNGSEFEGKVSSLLSELKITHVFSSPRSPKQNPFVERVIQTFINELHILKGTGYSLDNQQELISNYVYTYNYERPHQSLNYDTPFERYAKLTQSNTM